MKEFLDQCETSGMLDYSRARWIHWIRTFILNTLKLSSFNFTKYIVRVIMDLGYGAWRRLYILVIHPSNASSQLPRQCTWPKAKNNCVVHEDEQE